MPQKEYGQRGKMCLFCHILTKSALKFRYCPMLPSRHCFGVVPVTFLNKVMKYDTSLMPQSMATSETGLSFCPLKISLAISILTSVTRALLLPPVWVLIWRLRFDLVVQSTAAAS